MGKYREEKLEELMKLLKELLSKMSYRPSKAYSPIPRPKAAGGYPSKSKASLYYIPYRNSGYREGLKHNPKPERTIAGAPKPWNEPMLYQPVKERVVYDPDVKRMLQRIEKRLTSELDAEETLRLIETNPELYNRIYERLLEKADEDFQKQLEVAKREAEEEPKVEGLQAKPEPQEENAEDLKAKVEAEQDLEAKAERVTSELLGDEELRAEPIQEAKPTQSSVEPTVDMAEPREDIIEQLEAQDLSSLEAELYEEPLEALEPIEPAEPMLQSEPLEAEGEVREVEASNPS